MPVAADGQAEHERGRHIPRAARNGIEGPALSHDEGIPLDQILGGVAADHLLREATDGDILLRHAPGERDDPAGLRVDRADLGVDARDGDPDQPHGRRTLR